MRAGEVYASMKYDWAPEAASVLMTLEEVPEDGSFDLVKCLVIVDDAHLSMNGVGTTDEWQVDQLRNAFTRIT